MDKQRMEGGLKKATGTVKEKAGQMTGDRDLEAEGKVDKGEGKVRSAVGYVKDAASRKGLILAVHVYSDRPATTERI